MGLIKEYQSRNQMNFSFDNNDKNQQKLIKKQYDKNAGGLENINKDYENNVSNIYNNEQFKPLKTDYSSIGNKQIEENNKQTNIATVS